MPTTYKTGDLGHFGKDDNLYFRDRKDFQIKHQETIIHLTWTECKTVTHAKLHININHKTANDIVKVALELVLSVGVLINVDI